VSQNYKNWYMWSSVKLVSYLTLFNCTDYLVRNEKREDDYILSINFSDGTQRYSIMGHFFYETQK
jgi:hypothetical protein